MSTAIIGEWLAGGVAKIDIERLIASRALLQAGSGFGKSFALRKILEQTNGKVQQFIVDPDGEFATLREQYDYVIAAVNGGDALAHPRTAGLLCRRLMETGVSAILDISELKKPERRRFVRLFMEELMQLPRAMWSPLLVVIDECHEYAPETDEAESLSAVVDLATRGRKRGFALLAATQRIGKLSKDVAAELHNKLIGYTSLDNDIKRAAFELGMTNKDAVTALRALKPGDFYAFGPAIAGEMRALHIGAVNTTHPEPGMKKFRAPPKPTEAIKAVLPKLADLPKEAEDEARTIAELRTKNSDLERKVRVMESAPRELAPDQAVLDRVRQDGYEAGQLHGLGAARAAQESLIATLRHRIDAVFQDAKPVPPMDDGIETQYASRARPPQPIGFMTSVAMANLSGPDLAGRAPGEVSPAVRGILDAIHGAYPVSLSFDAAARRAGISSRSSAYRSYRKALSQSAEVEHDGSNFRSLPAYAKGGGMERGAGLDRWLGRLPPSYGKMLAAIHRHGPIDKDRIAELAGISPTSSGLGAGLSELKRLQLIVADDGAYQSATGL